ncbi:MAG: hypothetical protein Q9206_006001 [Seirophora lacunosa]
MNQQDYRGCSVDGAMFPTTVLWLPWPSPQVKNMVRTFGMRWFREQYPMTDHQYLDLRDAEWRVVYNQMLSVVAPLLFNVIRGRGMWRIPLVQAEGSACFLQSAMAMLLCDHEVGWECDGLGKGAHGGDLILSRPLRVEEILELSHGSFPRSLQRVGLPGPEVCEGSNQVFVLESAATSVRPPRAPRASVSTYQQLNIEDAESYRGRPRQPRQPSPLSGMDHAPRRPRKYNVSLSDSSSSTDSDEKPDPKVKKAKKAKKTKTKGKAPCRKRSPSVDSVTEKAGRLAVTDGKSHQPKQPARNPTSLMAESDDENGPRPSRQATARGPPRPTLPGPQSRQGEPSSSGWARPSPEGVRRKERSVAEVEEPPTGEPAKRKNLTALKEKNEWGKGKGKGQ